MRLLKYNKLKNIFILIFLLNGIHYAQEPGDIIVADLMEFMTAEAIQAELKDEIEEFSDFSPNVFHFFLLSFF